MKSGTRFMVKDLVNIEMEWDEVPIEIKNNVEKMFYDYVTNNRFVKGRVPDGKDADGVRWYKKLSTSTFLYLYKLLRIIY